MDVQIFGFETFFRKSEPGDLVAAVLEDKPIIGLRGKDQDGDYIIVLQGSSEAPPAIVDLDQFGRSVAVIEGTVTIEPLDPTSAFAQERVSPNTPGALLLGPEGIAGIAVQYRQLGRTHVFHYSLTTGGPWEDDTKAVGFAKWRMLLKQDGRREPFEIVRFEA